MDEKRYGQTAREWAQQYFHHAVCPGCGRGIDHHWIVPAPGLDVWFAQCYEQPKVLNTVILWAVDEDAQLTDEDDESNYRLYCQAVTTVKFSIESASPGDIHRLETFMSAGLHGIIPPDIPRYEEDEWNSRMQGIESDEVHELRMHVAHFNVDLESYDESLKSAKRVKRGW